MADELLLVTCAFTIKILKTSSDVFKFSTNNYLRECDSVYAVQALTPEILHGRKGLQHADDRNKIPRGWNVFQRKLLEKFKPFIFKVSKNKLKQYLTK